MSLIAPIFNRKTINTYKGHLLKPEENRYSPKHYKWNVKHKNIAPIFHSKWFVNIYITKIVNYFLLLSKPNSEQFIYLIAVKEKILFIYLLKK